MRWTIRTRMLTVVNLLVLAVGISVGWVGIHAAGQLVETRYTNDAVRHAATLAGQMHVPVTDMLLVRLKTILGGDVCAFADDGGRAAKLLASSLDAAARAEFLRQVREADGIPAEVRLGGLAYSVSSASTAVQPDEGGAVRLCLLTSKSWLAQERRHAAQRILLATAAAVAAATLLGLWLSLSLTRPVLSLAGQISGLSRKVEDGTGNDGCALDVTVPPGAPAEIEQFACAFRGLLRQLEQSREQLARTAQLAALGRLSASVVHELRNPLSGIKMNAQLVADGAPPETAQSLALIIREVERMDLYLQELLGLASGAGAAGSRENDGAPVRLEEAARSVLALLEGRLRHGRVTAVAEFAPGLPAVRGDANKARQVILNLVLNAVEAMTDGGRIRLSAAPAPGSVEDGAFIRFSVADSGPGVVLPDSGTDIFDPFVSTRPKGTGLGLYICRRIIGGMGGRIGYDSTLQGATFWFELPAADPDSLRAPG